MSKLLKLDDKFITQLINTPETGMGYHVVDIILITGEVIREKTILNSSFMQLNDDEDFDNNTIASMKLSVVK